MLFHVFRGTTCALHRKPLYAALRGKMPCAAWGSTMTIITYFVRHLLPARWSRRGSGSGDDDGSDNNDSLPQRHEVVVRRGSVKERRNGVEEQRQAAAAAAAESAGASGG